jgi:hypothetical protein
MYVHDAEWLANISTRLYSPVLDRFFFRSIFIDRLSTRSFFILPSSARRAFFRSFPSIFDRSTVHDDDAATVTRCNVSKVDFSRSEC